MWNDNYFYQLSNLQDLGELIISFTKLIDLEALKSLPYLSTDE